MIIWVSVVLRTVDGDWRIDNLGGSHLQSHVNSVCQSMIEWQTLFTWLWRWLPLRLPIHQSPTTVFRTTLTRTITQYELQHRMLALPGLLLSFDSPVALILKHVTLWVIYINYSQVPHNIKGSPGIVSCNRCDGLNTVKPTTQCPQEVDAYESWDHILPY